MYPIDDLHWKVERARARIRELLDSGEKLKKRPSGKETLSHDLYLAGYVDALRDVVREMDFYFVSCEPVESEDSKLLLNMETQG